MSQNNQEQNGYADQKTIGPLGDKVKNIKDQGRQPAGGDKADIQ